MVVIHSGRIQLDNIFYNMPIRVRSSLEVPRRYLLKDSKGH